jgi:anti-sigma regulatory factor (Ser/Thr protein kinase)
VSITTFAPATAQPHDDSIVFNPATADDVATARIYVQLTLLNAPDSVVDSTVLVVSELLGNAILHGRPRVTLTVRDTPDGIKIEVVDEGHRTAPADHRPAGEHGLGLIIVQAHCTELTIHHTATSTIARATVRNPKDISR